MLGQQNIKSFVCLFSQSFYRSVGQSVSRACNSYIMRENLLLQVVEISGKLVKYVVARQGHNRGGGGFLCVI